MTSQRIFNVNNIAKNINSSSSLHPASGIYVLQESDHCWAAIYVNCSTDCTMSTFFWATLYFTKHSLHIKINPLLLDTKWKGTNVNNTYLSIGTSLHYVLLSFHRLIVSSHQIKLTPVVVLTKSKSSAGFCHLAQMAAT